MNPCLTEDEIPHNGRTWPEYASTMLLCFDGWNGDTVMGRLCTFYFHEPRAFCGLDNLLLAMDAVMDEAGQPSVWCELRHLPDKRNRRDPEPQASPALSIREPLPADALSRMHGKLCTVAVRVYTRQHASMQGEARFPDLSPEPVYFRSALELLHLLHERLDRKRPHEPSDTAPIQYQEQPAGSKTRQL